MNIQKIPTTLDDIVKNALIFSFRKKFGPFQKCPECYGLLKSCGLCHGEKKVSVAEVEAYNNPITKMLREKNKKQLSIQL